MKKLTCKLAMWNGESSILTVGKVYPVVKETVMDFAIRNDEGDFHHFGKRIDEEGTSYRTWFDAIEDKGIPFKEGIERILEGETLTWSDGITTVENIDKSYFVEVFALEDLTIADLFYGVWLENN